MISLIPWLMWTVIGDEKGKRAEVEKVPGRKDTQGQCRGFARGDQTIEGGRCQRMNRAPFPIPACTSTALMQYPTRAQSCDLTLFRCDEG